MNFEELLSELGQDLQNIPGEMDKAGMQKSMTRRRTIHRVSVVGKTAACLLATMFMVLFVGVNTSVKFARAATSAPVIGNLSEAIIIREEIRKEIREEMRDSLAEHPDLEKPIEEGELVAVSTVVPGKKYPIEFTLDSVMVDEHAVTIFTKFDTSLIVNGYYTIQNQKFIDLDTGEEIHVELDNHAPFYESGTIYMTRFYWEKAHTNFSMDFELVEVSDYINPVKVLESYHFEFRDAKISESRHVSIDQTITFKGHDFHFVELRIAPSGTKIVYEVPQEKTINFAAFGFTIEDENGNMLAKAVSGLAGYNTDGKDGKTYYTVPYSSFYYEDVSKIRLHISDCYCSLFDEEVMTIDSEARTGTFNGKTFPVQVIKGRVHADKLGIPEEYVSHYEWEGASLTTLLVPVLEGMPDFNSRTYTDEHPSEYCYEFPKAMIDGQEYFVIQVPAYAIEDNGKCHFVHGTEMDTIIFQKYIDITL